MRSVEVRLDDRSYPVLVGTGLLDDAGTWARLLPESLIVVVTNDRVAPLYLERLTSAVPDRKVRSFVLPDGEAEKNLSNYAALIDFLAEQEAGRDCCLLALGGGVVGDLCGFAAATWMRGVRFVQSPTTLLAQVDASVGGKTGVNHLRGKNLIGAFHQPEAVVADIDTLATLDDREFRAGLAEVVKYGAIRDVGLLDYLEGHASDIAARQTDCLAYIVRESVRHKAWIVARDERETGLRAILNFGHSFGHALETVTGYALFLHGEAVAIGMVVAARLSEMRGLCEQGIADRLRRVLLNFELPVTVPAAVSSGDLLAAMRLDKKNLSGSQRLILLDRAGHAMVDTNSTGAQIRAAIDACRTAEREENHA